jgi:hypothetical protein
MAKPAGAVSHHLATSPPGASGIPPGVACTRLTRLDMLPAMSGGPAERWAAIAVALSAIVSWADKRATRLHHPHMPAGAPPT